MGTNLIDLVLFSWVLLQVINAFIELNNKGVWVLCLAHEIYCDVLMLSDHCSVICQKATEPEI